MNKSLYFFILLFMFSITSCGVFQKEEEEKKIETHSTDFNFVEINAPTLLVQGLTSIFLYNTV